MAKEYLDIYDENRNHIGKECRKVVHEKGLWHKTVHCWLYDKHGNVYFQLREDVNGKANKMYTTASGHVSAGETLQDAFKREVREEIGIDVDISNAQLVEIVVWKMDRIIIDRVFAHIYVNEIESESQQFDFLDGESNGIIKVNAKSALDLLRKEKGSIPAEKIDTSNKREKVKISMDDFLIYPHEIGIVKFGRVLSFIAGMFAHRA